MTKIVGYCALIAIGVLLFVSAQPQDGGTASGCSDRYGAYAAAQTFVERRLKSPGSAEFPWITDVSVSKGASDCIYTIDGYVDAENSFSANLRSRYMATVEYLPASREWRLQDMQWR